MVLTQGRRNNTFQKFATILRTSSSSEKRREDFCYCVAAAAKVQYLQASFSCQEPNSCSSCCSDGWHLSFLPLTVVACLKDYWYFLGGGRRSSSITQSECSHCELRASERSDGPQLGVSPPTDAFWVVSVLHHEEIKTMKSNLLYFAKTVKKTTKRNRKLVWEDYFLTIWQLILLCSLRVFIYVDKTYSKMKLIRKIWLNNATRQCFILC